MTATTPDPAPERLARPVRVALVNDFEVVVRGLHGMLAPYAERVRVVELDSRAPVVSDVDVVLYDTFGQAQVDRVDLTDLVRDGGAGGAGVVVWSWNVQPELVAAAKGQGVRGYLSKELPAEELVGALEEVASGAVVTRTAPASTGEPEPVRDPAPRGRRRHGSWPGRDEGLTEREAEIIALIARGLSNQEIADLAYLSINSVKTYIRTAYRKMGVTRRSQAVRWALEHGFVPDHLRVVRPEAHRGDAAGSSAG